MDEQQISKISINNESDIKNIDFDNPSNYDFSSCPNDLRPKIFCQFFRIQYKKALDENFSKTNRILTQATYARELNINKMTISKYLSNNRAPGIKNLEKFALKYGNIVYEIMGISSLKTPNNPKLEEYIELFNKLNPEDQSELMQYAKIMINKYDKLK